MTPKNAIYFGIGEIKYQDFNTNVQYTKKKDIESITLSSGTFLPGTHTWLWYFQLLYFNFFCSLKKKYCTVSSTT